jgi:DNA-binding NtrC family response regulator
VIAATNRRLDRAVAAGSFREDLYFRLNVFPIALPPLRERLEDVPALVTHFTTRLRPRHPPAFSAEAVAALAAYPWPGNVRELANVVERLVILAGGEGIGIDLVRQVLPADGATRRPSLPDAAAADRPLSEALDDYERQLIREAIARSGGNVAEAARQLRTDRANLYRRMRRLGM